MDDSVARFEDDAQRRNQIEGILIAAMPTANGAKPKLVKQVYPKELRELVRRIRRGAFKGLDNP